MTHGIDRLAVVVEVVLAGDNAIQSSDDYHAVVRDHIKLTYNGVAAWLGNEVAGVRV